MTGAAAAILALLEQRGAGKTICPSEAARLIAGPEGDWRSSMTAVHDAVDTLVSEGRVAVSWKGEPLSRSDGPYRIAAAQ